MKTLDSKKLVLALLVLLPTGCVEQYMANQPKYKPLTASSLFPDGRSSRPLVEGTVSRNYRDDPHLMAGLNPKPAAGMAAGNREGEPAGELVALQEPGPMPAPPATPNKANGEKFVAQFATTFPMVVSKEMIERGRQRYNIYCSVCHGYTGSGDGMVVQRGFTPPPSLVGDNPVEKENFSRGIAYQGLAVPLPEAPVGYYFHVMTVGYGAMPMYASQIPVEDRWAIASYLRALQLSQRYKVSAATDEIKKKLAESEQQATKKEGGAH